MYLQDPPWQHEGGPLARKSVRFERTGKTIGIYLELVFIGQELK